MPLISACQLPPPSNWQDLEALCADLWQAEWNNPTLQRHGRSGQAQHGIDVSGQDKDNALIGIQCKCIGADTVLSQADIRAEVKKAKEFSANLSHYILATTGLKDTAVEKLCRELSKAHQSANLFTVTYYGWQDICLMMGRHPLIAAAHFPFAIFSKTPLVLNNETSTAWADLQFSFTHPEYIHPRIVEELQGYISDRNHTIISIDLTAANQSNRFYGEFETEECAGRLRIGYKDQSPDCRAWFDYTYVGASVSGTHIVWTRECGGGSGVFHRLLFLVLQRDTGLVQNGYEVTCRDRVLLKILGSISLGDRYYGDARYRNDLLKIGGVRKSAGVPFASKPFSLHIK